MIEFIFESAAFLGGFSMLMLGAKAVLLLCGSEKYKAIKF